MKNSGEKKFFIGTVFFTLIILVGAVFFFQQPSATYSFDDLKPKGSGFLGQTTASIQLIEFSDYQCPACKSFKPIVEDIIEAYGDKIFFGYRHFPLPQHIYAEFSARAVEAAGVQGKYWEMHDFLFQNQDILTEEFILNGASDLGLNVEQFGKDLDSRDLKDLVLNDKADGVRFGVNATPTFFLNGKKLTINNYTDLKKAIENELK